MHRVRHFLFSTVFTRSPDFTLCNDRRLNPVLRLKLFKHRYFLVIPPDTILCSTCRFFADYNFLVDFSCDSSELDNKSFLLTNLFLFGVKFSCSISMSVCFLGVNSDGPAVLVCSIFFVNRSIFLSFVLCLFLKVSISSFKFPMFLWARDNAFVLVFFNPLAHYCEMY